MRTFIKTFQIVFVILIACYGPVDAQKVYFVSTPDSAQIKCFVTTDTNVVDLKVYNIDSEENANRDGLWYTISSAEEADLRIFIVTESGLADMNIMYVVEDELAGWVTTNKRYLFKVN